jgi:hypothetical protein
MHQLGFHLVLVDTRARERHRPPMRVARDGARAPQQRDLVRILDEAHRVERRTDVDDFLRCRDAAARTIANLVQQVGDFAVPVAEQAERRVQRGAVGCHVRQPLAQRADRMRFVEPEDLACGVGAVAKAVPDLAFLVALAAEQHVLVAVRSRVERDHRFGFGESGQIIEIAVVSIREQRVAVARDLRSRRHERQAAAARAHRLQQGVAPRAIDLVCVVHHGILQRDRA